MYINIYNEVQVVLTLKYTERNAVCVWRNLNSILAFLISFALDDYCTKLKD